MNVIDVGGTVTQLRFFSDNRRLLVGSAGAQRNVHFEILSLTRTDPARLKIPMPSLLLDLWLYTGHGHAVAPHPSGDSCVVAWGGILLAFRTADGRSLPVPEGVTAHQVCYSPDGKRLMVADLSHSHKQLFALAVGPRKTAVVWQKDAPPAFRHLAGILPDGDRFVTIDDMVRIRTFESDTEEAAARYPTYNANHPQISPDGRYLGVIGYSCMYLYDLTALGKPRRIGGQRSFGNFVGFAFHPNGRHMAVIHGGPTLVKVYDLATLKIAHTYKWKLGPLTSVAYSPDGTLGAAGTQDGRIVVWDEDG